MARATMTLMTSIMVSKAWPRRARRYFIKATSCESDTEMTLGCLKNLIPALRAGGRLPERTQNSQHDIENHEPDDDADDLPVGKASRLASEPLDMELLEISAFFKETGAKLFPQAAVAHTFRGRAPYACGLYPPLKNLAGKYFTQSRCSSAWESVRLKTGTSCVQITPAALYLISQCHEAVVEMERQLLKRLSEKRLRTLSDEKSFERGKEYFRDGMIFDAVLQGDVLRARCRGSLREPYLVKVALNKRGVAEFSCTCPRGGFCKHVIALALEGIHEPLAIRVLPPLASTLKQFSKDELAALVSEMLEREPDLNDVVELAASRRGGGVDISSLKRLAGRAMEKDSSREIEEGLRGVCKAVEGLLESGKWLDAGAAYSMLLDESASNYGDKMLDVDEEGELACVVDEIAEGLVQCLKKASADEETRRKWLDTLLKAVIADVDLGGIDLAPSAEEALRSCVSDKEKTYIEDRVRTEMGKRCGWEREALENFLTGED